MLLNPLGLLRLIPTGGRHPCHVRAPALWAARETGFSTLKNPQDRISYSRTRDQSHQKAKVSRKAAAHPCSSQHAAGSRERMEPTAASLLPTQGRSVVAPTPPWAALLTPSVFFSPYFITEETFLKIPVLTSKPGSLGNKGGRDGSRRSVPILRISNVALYIFIFIFFIKDIPRYKAEQESLQSIYWDIISHLQQTQQLSMPRE